MLLYFPHRNWELTWVLSSFTWEKNKGNSSRGTGPAWEEEPGADPATLHQHLLRVLFLVWLWLGWVRVQRETQNRCQLGALLKPGKDLGCAVAASLGYLAAPGGQVPAT